MFESKLFKFIVFLTIVLLLSACSGDEETISKEADDPTPGVFKGETSQGEQIILEVKEVNGQMVLASIQYKIKMNAQGWSVTNELMQPSPRQISIIDGTFSGSHTSDNTTEEISGKFIGDEGAEGRLHCTLEHPQGLGTAVGDVTFVVNKTNP
jgi:hypothetical protein